MDKTVSITTLRSDIYALVDQVITTGRPLYIQRNGHRVKLTPVKDTKTRKKKKGDILNQLTPIPGLIVGDPDDLAEFKVWNEKEWRTPGQI